MDENIFKRLNLQTYEVEKLTIDPSAVPNLISNEQLKLWQAGDTDPYYKLVQFKYPIIANEENYTENYFETYLKKLTNHPIPGSKSGHETKFMATAPTDFVVIGGNIEKNGDGSGKALLKIYVPKKGDSDNETFIKSLKSNMVHFSMVAYVRQEKNINGDQVIYNNVESHHGERLDAVGWGEGAMKQVTNKKDDEIITSLSDDELNNYTEKLNAEIKKRFNVVGQKVNLKGMNNAKSLIRSGNIDETSTWSFSGDDGNKLLGDNGDDWANYAKWHMVENTSATENTKVRYSYPFGKNGKLYRSALRAITSRAGAQGFEELSNMASDLIKSIDDKKQSSGAGKSNKGESNMKDELLIQLKELKDAKVTLAEIAEALDEKDTIVTQDHIKAVKLMNACKDAGIEDPVTEVAALKKQLKANEKLIFDVTLKENYGDNKDGKNMLFNYAAKMLAGKTGQELMAEIEKLKTDEVAMHLAKNKADINSDENKLAFIEPKKSTDMTTEDLNSHNVDIA